MVARSKVGETVSDVIVIGAGMAGLAAARIIAEAGLQVVVLEAQQRVGGRIRTVREGGEMIELGAEFIHGQPSELWELIAEAGLETYERTGAFMRVGEGGGPVAMEDDGDDVLKGLEDFAGPDCSFAEYVAGLGLSEEEVAREVGYVEGFNAADAREASVMALGRQQKAEDAIDGDRSWRLTAGYNQLTEFLRGRVEAAEGVMVLGAEVVSVEWNQKENSKRNAEARGRTRVCCADGREFSADKVVVTLPLGMLQARAVRFSPNPVKVMEAASRMRMGHVSRVTLTFRRRIWPEELSFLLARESVPSVWWSARPSESLALTGWVGGPRATKSNHMTAQELEVQAIAGLASALGLGEEAIRSEVVGFYMHEWDSDEFARGAYSWVPVGGLEASAEMSEPVEGTLYFAGEHTDNTGHWGTVHAALRSGLRAGRQVLGLC